MSKDDEGRDGGTQFSFAPPPADAPDRLRELARSLELHTDSWSDEDRGCDPYNTSGRFDANRGWKRVGRR